MDQPRSERTATDRRPNGYADPSALVGFRSRLGVCGSSSSISPCLRTFCKTCSKWLAGQAARAAARRGSSLWSATAKTLGSLAACEGRATHLAKAAVGIVLVMAG